MLSFRDRLGGWGERRHSQRWRTHTAVCWRPQGGRRERRSLLVERSLNGFAMMVAAGDEPKDGARLIRGCNGEHRRRLFGSAIVVRVERLQDDVHLVYAEIES